VSPRVLLSVVFLLCASATFADQVTLKNGDRLSGAIVKYDQDKLLIKSELAGDVTVPWEAVVSIKSTAPLHVALKNGQTVVGIVTTTGERFEVAAPSGPVEAGKTEIVAVRNDAEEAEYARAQHPRLVDMWSGLVDTGLSLTSGNSQSTAFTLAGKAARVTSRTKVALYATDIYTKSTINDVTNTTASAIRGGVRVDYNLRPKVFVFGLADFEHDRFQDLDLRSVLGGGLGYHVIKEKDRAFDVFGGLTFNNEQYSKAFAPPDPSTTRKTSEVVVGETFTTKLGARSTLAEQFSFFPNLSDTGDYRLQFDTTAATKLKNWLSWQITFSDRYVSRPLTGLKDNDLLFSTGLRLTFGKGVF